MLHQLFLLTSTLLLSTNALTMKLRSVQKILPKTTPHWVGDGFRVYPVFGHSAFTAELSPLLMFDYAEPKRFPAKLGPPLGVGTHPHRGFETVTLAFQGEVEHSDSRGHSGVIGPGDVQWMTAGKGILHEEFHSKEFTKTGGIFEMIQLWVNLPKKHKMTKPRYQEIKDKKIPVVNLPLGGDNDEREPAGTARIVAGQLGDAKGPAKTFSPVQLWDVTLPEKGTEVDLPFPTDQTCILFARRGSVEIVNGQDDDSCVVLRPQEVALMKNGEGSDTIRVRVLTSDTSLLVLGGEPLDEPIANMGPFVMNTKEELHQAVSDFRSGKFAR